MRLPNADHAIVSAEKLRHYLLSMEHPRGVHKATVFRAAGYHREKWFRLRHDLMQLARSNDAQELIRTLHGTKFEVRGTLQGPLGPLDVITVWIVLRRERFPRLVTAYRERPR